MNLKACFALALIVLSVLSVISVFPGSSFITPCGTDDGKFEQFGPRPSQLLIKIYTGGYTAEIADFKAQGIDVEDWPLAPSDYQYFATNDPNHLTWSTASTNQFGLFEFDLNDQVTPTNIVAFRRALSYLMDKDYFISHYLNGSGLQTGYGAKADSPIASITGWYNPALTDLYNKQPRTTMTPYPDDTLDMQAAYNALVASGLSVVTDPSPNPGAVGTLMWTWTSPFNDNPGRPTAPPFIKDGHLLFFARADSMVSRYQSALVLKQLLEQSLPNWMAANGLPATHVNVDLMYVPRKTTEQEVMTYYRYHAYTGGWSLDSTPDFLQFYTMSEILKPLPSPYTPNYCAYGDPNYDLEVALMLQATSIGSSTNPCTAKYHAYLAQQIFMSDAAMIPMWYSIAYTACLSNLRGVVNAVGVGLNNWFTFLDAYKAGGAGGGDTIKYGFMSDVQSLNPISASWHWDWEVLGKVYDSLIVTNPYDPSDFRRSLADNWTISSYAGKTVLTLHLREDVWWQDVPAMDRSAYTFDKGHELDGPFVNVPLTPLDVAQAIEYIRDMDVWSVTNNGYLAGNVDHVVVSPIYAENWPYQTSDPPWYNSTDVVSQGGNSWQTNYVQFDPTLDSETIKLYLSDSTTWLGLYRIGSIPITPYHIFRYLATDSWYYNGTKVAGISTMDLTPNGADLLYGTGPYILLDHVAGDHITMIAYATSATYRGITEQNSYFWQPMRVADTQALDRGPEVKPAYDGTKVTNGYTIVNTDFNNAYTVDITPTLAYATYSGSWSPTTITTTLPPTTLIVPAGANTTVTFDFPIAGAPQWIVIHESFRLTITAGPSWMVGRSNTYGDFKPITGAKQWSDNVYYANRSYELLNSAANPLKGDANGDSTVGTADLQILGLNWGLTVPPGDPGADMNGDGVVGTADLHILGVQWGMIVPPDPTSSP